MQLSNGETDKQHVVVQKKKRSPWSTVAMVFLLLFAISAGTAAWFWYMWQNDHTSLTDARNATSTSEQTISGLRDELTKTKASLSDAVDDAANKTDEEQIKAAAKRHNSLLATPLQNVTVKIDKTEGAQAIATVSDNSGGAYKSYLKKSDGVWGVVWSGQNTPPAEVATQYGIKP